MGGRLPETTGTAANRKCFVRKHIPRHRPVTGNYRYSNYSTHASDAGPCGIEGNPELSLGTGIVMRVLLFVVLYVVGTALVLRYAESVRKDPTRSAVYGLPVNTLMDESSAKEMPTLTGKRK